MGKIAQQLEITRKELLDMGLRGNPLLSFKHSKAKTLEIIDEISEEIYKILVNDSKAMKFLPIPEKTLSENGDEAGIRLTQITEYLSENKGIDRFTDNSLQTRLAPNKLDIRLVKINSEAKTYLEEQGVDILYLALGFLNWYEDPNSDNPRKAPLVLMPVQLNRSTANEGFKLSYTDADLGPNLALSAKMNSDFNILMPDYAEEFLISDYFSDVEKAISKNERWSVSPNEIALGFFSFGKFQMYKDLDEKTWGEESKPSDHPVLNSLFDRGFNVKNYEDSYPDVAREEIINRSELTHFVYDSDPSQTEATLMAIAGNNLVIQGPPGTGKSQTITNIISEAIAHNKTVLFVAEKMAALEVVKRRLDVCHLGDAVLELHSHKANKKAVLDSIQKALLQDMPVLPNRESEIRQLKETRSQLDNYCNAVNSPILNSETTYIKALGHYIRLSESLVDITIPDIGFENLKYWDDSKLDNACLKLSEIVVLLKDMGPVNENPFHLTTKTSFSPKEQNIAEKLMVESKQNIEKIHEIIGSVIAQLDIESPKNINETLALFANVKLVISAPDITGIDITSPSWTLKTDQINTLLKAGVKISTIVQKYKDSILPNVFDTDFFNTRNVIKNVGNKWWKIFSSDYRKAKKHIQSYYKSTPSENPDDWLKLLDNVTDYQVYIKDFDNLKFIGESLFKEQWTGVLSDWDALARVNDWVSDLHENIELGKANKECFNYMGFKTEFESSLESIDTCKITIKALQSDLNELEQVFQLPQSSTFDDSLDLTVIGKVIESWEHSISSIYQISRFNFLLKEFSHFDLLKLDITITTWGLEPNLLIDILKYNWFEGLVNYAYDKHEEIKHFDASTHEHAQAEFKRLDAQLMEFSQESLVSKLHARLPSSTARGQIETLRKEFGKKRRHMPIRKLISQTAEGIQRIKPIFMMSPMSVATYLPQGAIDFDLVVFDEASQIKVADALGSILRGKQTVVVGDTKQMPPSDFFGKALMLDDDEADESITADLESILSLFVVGGAPESMLKTHYRSKHESLIAFSNDEFYERKLRIFPSSGTNTKAKGLSFHHNPENIYERGSSRTNPLEAQQIAQAVLKHAKESPELTLGVVAFSMAQREAIMLEVESLRRKHKELEDFYHKAPDGEGLFVKNLENVQGDERDVIFISIAYGRTSTGKITQSFGPINHEGGQRRLNVLVTRARMAMEVFCNFTSEDIKVTADSPWGLKALRNFLQFAETGDLITNTETGKEPDSPFEEEVIKVIKDLGYDVEPQVGCSGYYLDIAVRDPLHTGRYILAVECDGASYHSSASARDRDRMRQGVLEGLGWRFHRIWSTDWFRTRKDQSIRLKEAIELAIKEQRDLEDSPSVKKPERVKESFSIARIEQAPVKYFSLTKYEQIDINTLKLNSAISIYDTEVGELASALMQIIELESPIHTSLLTHKLCSFYDLSRTGNKIKNIIDDSIKALERSHEITISEDFIYRTGKKIIPRDRSTLNAAFKKFDYVAKEEIENILLHIVGEAIAIISKDLLLETVKQLGYSKVTSQVEQRLNSICISLENRNKLCRNGNEYQQGEASNTVEDQTNEKLMQQKIVSDLQYIESKDNGNETLDRVNLTATDNNEKTADVKLINKEVIPEKLKKSLEQIEGFSINYTGSEAELVKLTKHIKSENFKLAEFTVKSILTKQSNLKSMEEGLPANIQTLMDEIENSKVNFPNRDRQVNHLENMINKGKFNIFEINAKKLIEQQHNLNITTNGYPEDVKSLLERIQTDEWAEKEIDKVKYFIDRGQFKMALMTAKSNNN